MKILLIDNFQNITPGSPGYSAGLLSLATILKQKSYDVEIINFEYLFNKEILPYSNEPAKNFQTMSDYIINKNPDVAGFTAMCNSFHNALLLSELIKKRKGKIKIILGGPHVSIFPEKVLREFEWIDLICIGEGEKKIELILKGLEENDLSQVPGIARRKDGNIVINEDIDIIRDLDELPLLDYTLIPYFNECTEVSIEAGRGCPYGCTYCSTSTFWKRRFRMKSPDRIIKEVLYIKNITGNRGVKFDFVHDNFTSNHRFILEFTEKVRPLNIEWFCSARVDTLNEELIENMASSGCSEIYIGIESGSEVIQKDINKNLKLDKVYEVMDMLAKNNISPIISFMYGFPTEREEDLQETLHMIYSLLKKGLYHCQFHSLCVLGGTKMFEDYGHRLVRRDFYSDMADPSNLELCRSFISKNKDLFSHFYILDETTVDRYYLLDKFVFYVFISLYKYFYKTLDYIIKIFDGDILNFYRDFLLNTDNRFIYFFKGKHYVRDFIEYPEIIENMVDFLELYIARRAHIPGFNIVFNKFNMENFKFRMKYRPSLPKIRISGGA